MNQIFVKQVFYNNLKSIDSTQSLQQPNFQTILYQLKAYITGNNAEEIVQLFKLVKDVSNKTFLSIFCLDDFLIYCVENIGILTQIGCLKQLMQIFMNLLNDCPEINFEILGMYYQIKNQLSSSIVVQQYLKLLIIQLNYINNQDQRQIQLFTNIVLDLILDVRIFHMKSLKYQNSSKRIDGPKDQFVKILNQCSFELPLQILEYITVINNECQYYLSIIDVMKKQLEYNVGLLEICAQWLQADKFQDLSVKLQIFLFYAQQSYLNQYDIMIDTDMINKFVATVIKGLQSEYCHTKWFAYKSAIYLMLCGLNTGGIVSTPKFQQVHFEVGQICEQNEELKYLHTCMEQELQNRSI